MSLYHGRDVTRHSPDQLYRLCAGTSGAPPRLESCTGSDDVPDGRVGRPRAALSAGPRHGGLVQFLSASGVSTLLWTAPQSVAGSLAATGAAHRSFSCDLHPAQRLARTVALESEADDGGVVEQRTRDLVAPVKRSEVVRCNARDFGDAAPLGAHVSVASARALPGEWRRPK